MPDILMPCPFCGSTNVDIFDSFGDAETGLNFCNVQCINCGAQGASRLGQEKAANSWNCRQQQQQSLNHDIIALIYDINRCNTYKQFKLIITKARNILNHHKEDHS